MALHSTYVCQQCGYTSRGWLGKCPECGTWGSLVETVVETKSNASNKSKKSITGNITTQKLSDVKEIDTKRISTNIPELDRVLGGGLVPGQVILIAGEPGIGKSTLLTQLANQLSVVGGQLSEKSLSVSQLSEKQKTSKPNSENGQQKTENRTVLYVCGEESPSQVAVRAQRLGISNKNIELVDTTDVDEVVSLISNLQTLSSIIIDSIQTMTTSDLSGMAGSVGQVRECANRLLHAAKEKNIPLFLVGHVTKEGTVAGPAVLAHIVDTVLWFEGDKTLTTRILRAVKNRFGPTDEVGVFEMAEKGLQGLENLESAFLEKNDKPVSGSVVTSVIQGTRPILVEIQALIVPTKLPIPRRIAQGIDSRRLELLIAVLTRRCGVPLFDSDVFINVAGGFKITEPAADVAISLAIASSYFDKPLSNKTVAVGEVGLLGEIREVVAQEKRLKEAKRLGFSNSISSKEYKYLSQAIKNIK